MAQTRLLLPRFVTHEAVEANVLNWWRCFLNLHEQYIDLAGPPYKWMWYKCITWICNMLKNIDDGRKTRTDPTYLRKSCKLIIAVWQRWTTAVRDQANCIYLDRLIPYVHHVQEEAKNKDIKAIIATVVIYKWRGMYSQRQGQFIAVANCPKLLLPLRF